MWQNGRGGGKEGGETVPKNENQTLYLSSADSLGIPQLLAASGREAAPAGRAPAGHDGESKCAHRAIAGVPS